MNGEIMRKKVIIIAAVVLLTVLLLVLLPKHGGDAEQGTQWDKNRELPDTWDHVIAYVPLDDRTDNIDNVIYLAEASGYRVVMPETDLIHTSLDGQEKNSNGTQYGDREKLLMWVREMDEKGCDLFLLSLDQLLSGGLVNSRALSESLPLEFDHGSMSEIQAFDEFVMALGQDKNNRVYMFDSVMRLASTVGYQGYDYAEYTAIRTYGRAARPELTGDKLTKENIYAAYKFGADGVSPAVDSVEDGELRAILTDEVIDNYLAARQRKLDILDHVMSELREKNDGRFRLLVGIDDSSNTANIQTSELAYISENLDENSSLVSGLDCLARTLVGIMARDEYGYGVKTYVSYFGGTEDLPSSEYDSCTVRETADIYMKLFGAQYADEEDAELQVVIMTKPADDSRKEEYCNALIEKLKANGKRNIPTVFIESSNTVYGKPLEDAVTENAELAELVGFSGKYYQANVVGSGFAMGFSRYMYLKSCDHRSVECDAAHLKQLTLSLELSYAFAINSRDQINSFVDGLGYNYNNILWNEGDKTAILNKTAELMNYYGAPLLENLRGGDVICSLEPFETRQIESLAISDYYMPWDRSFEISFNIDVNMK